ncbi:M-phase inducer phosphatase [Echria macrotheca]|uniref:M-phase inducer phosphatase n=1 Tax=Echria macrotheca TaxID=438768 RepID=A0AAJ0BJD0_9PEZI|nr:M-phase inducer phosphatase [Echria macrotheca]
METSSPLAALRPAPTSFGKHEFYGASSMSLHDQLNYQRSNREYFNVNNLRGSSPAASLAADLSQNFKLNDASSPMFPTPRRALFTTATVVDSMGSRGKLGQLYTASNGAGELMALAEYVTTPPLLMSSSPAPGDMMDISPLPHKSLYVMQMEVSSPSPSPAASYIDDMVMESPVPRPASTSMEPSKPIAAERRKLGVRRPSLNRAKGYSTGVISSRPHNEQPLPLFRLGDQLQSTSMSNDPTDWLEESPPQERRPQSANSPCPQSQVLRSKAHLGTASQTGVRNNSPKMGHARRPSNPFMRPRKQFRRSLSMFENPGDVINPFKKEELMQPTALQAVSDIEEPQDPILPHFLPEDQDDNIPRITKETMLDVLDGRYSAHFAHKIIIDCRFEYEYEGGHIDGAVNYNDKDLLADHLFRTPMEGRTLLIFHCEYSAHRAPIMARHIRAEDRTANAEHYPRLTYPEVYILDGGYSGFFADHRDRCQPQAYVAMNAAEHVNTCEREMGRLRNNRRNFGRAQTFAFGQRNRGVQDSPTGPGRARPRTVELPMESSDMLGASPILGQERGHVRRMVSL